MQAPRWLPRVCVALLLGSIVLFAIATIVDRRGGTVPDRDGGTVSDRESLLLKGQQAMKDGQYDVAFAMFTKAEEEELGDEWPTSAILDFALASLMVGKPAATERHLLSVLDREPGHATASALLCSLLRAAGRHWEARPHVLAMMRSGNFHLGSLIVLGTDEPLVGSDKERGEDEFILQRAAMLSRLSRARVSQHNDEQAAARLLRSVIQEDPNQMEAHARLGAILVTHNTGEFQKWNRGLPERATKHPEIWMTWGMYSEQLGDTRSAARCYWEALRRHPDHLLATYRLSQMLMAQERTADAKVFADRADLLSSLEHQVDVLDFRLVSDILENLGREWESLGWAQVAIQYARPKDDVTWAHQRISRLRQTITADTPLVPDQLALSLDLSDWPLPDWNAGLPSSREAVSGDLTFVDTSESAGISFSYFNGADAAHAYMFEFSGAGVAVLDYDGDGWPDIYLTQGCPWPVDPNQDQYRDRLYRNLGNGSFEDVTEAAHLVDRGFGQGVAAGDFDNDGFPDLFVANIGENQLYRNNGDGTFSDMTAAAGLGGKRWTVSTLIADLSGDGLPELYEVNYLGGDDVFTEVCGSPPIQCSPSFFPAENDRLFKNLGDGRFRDDSQQSGILNPNIVANGKGMGIVAADFDGSHRLSLFIANDTTNNFFFLNQTNPGAELLFAERALVSGLALSLSGRSASCMGIAVGDVNRDNRLDLFVTNFFDEPNNLFVQTESGLFNDEVRESRLHAPGYMLEGWGAQLLDADLDGLVDLVVANGHLDAYPHTTGTPLMPTQVFRNSGDRQFVEVPSNDLGGYFEKKYLGRAVARLDWNRDGRPDVLVTHVHAPTALLTNQTPDTGHFLAVRLCGVQSARDAIGATVSIRAGGQSWSKQLVAGDGYQASNQRQLIFGLGSAAEVDEVKISWPSGDEETHRGFTADKQLLFIEGMSSPIEL